VVNLRGKVIPVLDLKLKFGMEETDYTERTCIIVVEMESRKGRVQLGIVVDSVSDVINILGEEIEEPPELAARADEGSILGMAKTGDRVKILLDIDRVLSLGEINALESADF
jgi:purine-binding chemotaxis protein CheW